MKRTILLAVITTLLVFFPPCTVSLSAATARPVASLSPTSLAFGSQTVGKTSAAKTVTLKNTGNATLSIATVTIWGTNASSFAESNNCGSSLAAGRSCTISVTFKPSTTSGLGATLSLFDNAVGSQRVILSGTGTAPTPAATPTFSIQSGTYASPQTLTISDATTGATIYYTTNGSTPTTSSAKYTGAITVSSTETIEAIATANGYSCSSVATATYTITPPAGTPSFVQAVASASHGGPSSVNLAFPANTLPGDVLLVAFDYEGSATVPSVTDIQGNAFTPVGNLLTSPGGAPSQVYYAANIKGGPETVKVTLSAASSYLEAYVTEYSGVNPTNPIDAEAGASGNAGAVSSGNATTTAGGDIIYGFCMGDGVCAVGSGFTARSTLESNLIEDMPAGSAGSYAATGTASNGWTMQMVALKPASASASDPAPGASLSPTSLTFASQTVGATSSAQTVTLSNTGNAALSITGISITGTNPADFAETNSCGPSVAAGASCTISVTFTPATSGSLAATLTFTDNATGSPQSVALTGTGASSGAGAGGGSTPSLTLSSTGLSFGSQPVDTSSSAQTVTLSNTGSAALSITSLTITGTNASDFAEIADTCGSSVAAGGTCTVEVTFTPSAASSFTATLSITDNASGSPQSVSLAGTGAHDVILSWTASTSSGVVGYNVYRGTTSGGENSTPLNSAPITGTTFTDSIVTAGQTYYYVITAVNASDTQSADSSEISATVPSP